MRRPRIFISYTSTNQNFARNLAHRLQQNYRHVWFDEHVPFGEDYWEVILTEIQKCDIFIYIVSDAWKQSPACEKELREAKELGKKCLPILCEKVAFSFPIRWLDMSGG